MIIDYEKAPQYSSASGDAYFDWSDTKGFNARQLASRFIERFPDVVENGEGQDWEYAGWFTSLLGYTETTGTLSIIIGRECSNKKCIRVPRPPTSVYGLDSIDEVE